MSAKIAALLLIIIAYVFGFLHGYYNGNSQKQAVPGFRQRRRIALSRKSRGCYRR